MSPLNPKRPSWLATLLLGLFSCFVLVVWLADIPFMLQYIGIGSLFIWAPLFLVGFIADWIDRHKRK